jgi:hypothetical protein
MHSSFSKRFAVQPTITLLLVSWLISPAHLNANGCGSCAAPSGFSNATRSRASQAFPTLAKQFGGRDEPRTIPRIRTGSNGTSTVTVMQQGTANVDLTGNQTAYATAGRGSGANQPLPGLPTTTVPAPRAARMQVKPLPHLSTHPQAAPASRLPIHRSHGRKILSPPQTEEAQGIRPKQAAATKPPVRTCPSPRPRLPLTSRPPGPSYRTNMEWAWNQVLARQTLQWQALPPQSLRWSMFRTFLRRRYLWGAGRATVKSRVI